MVDDLRFGMAISNVISDEPVKVTRSSVGAPPSGAVVARIGGGCLGAVADVVRYGVGPADLGE